MRAHTYTHARAFASVRVYAQVSEIREYVWEMIAGR